MHRLTAMFATFFQDKQGKFVIIQWPNIPLWIIIGAWALRHFAHGVLHTIVDMGFVAAVLVWSWLEITSGDSPFRRVLGAVVLLWVLANRLLQWL